MLWLYLYAWDKSMVEAAAAAAGWCLHENKWPNWASIFNPTVVVVFTFSIHFVNSRSREWMRKKVLFLSLRRRRKQKSITTTKFTLAFRSRRMLPTDEEISAALRKMLCFALLSVGSEDGIGWVCSPSQQVDGWRRAAFNDREGKRARKPTTLTDFFHH